MDVITDSKTLKKRIADFKKEPFVTIDTEFIREKTYYPVLCLIQMAGSKDAFAIDAMAEDLDISPLYKLLANKKIVKVFHAAEQDIEILYRLTGEIPAPLFDTQIAAQVLGYGDSAGYGALVKDICGVDLDKSSRFTDWAHRPLTQAQVDYAVSDVTYLRNVCENLLMRLEEKKRMDWFKEEMLEMLNPARYEVQPEEAWKRFKIKNASPVFYGVLHAVAEWRERRAQSKNLPRGRVMRDEAVLEIAASRPSTKDALFKLRSVHPNMLREDSVVDDVLNAIKRGIKHPLEQGYRKSHGPDGALIDLLRVLLKMQCENHDVARKVIANDDDLRAIAHMKKGEEKNADIQALHGWRWDVFGKSAIQLKNGEIGLAAQGRKLKVIQLDKKPKEDAEHEEH
jgi:ribonuclease D